MKNSAYLLPDGEETLEDFEWICQEIRQRGGAAWLFRAETLVGMSSGEIEEAFRQLRAPEYQELIQLARRVFQQEPPDRDEVFAAYEKLSRRSQDLRKIDFFGAPARRELEEVMSEMEKHVHASTAVRAGVAALGRIWVTRKGVKVDRIGSAWLIRRFIDPKATFRFVVPETYVHAEAEIRFDMLDGEFTHEGDQCTFEVLLTAHGLKQEHPALLAIAEMVHDIDLKEDRYRRPETAGLARMISGLCSQTPEDELRLERGGMIFESLYQSFSE